MACYIWTLFIPKCCPGRDLTFVWKSQTQEDEVDYVAEETEYLRPELPDPQVVVTSRESVL